MRAIFYISGVLIVSTTPHILKSLIYVPLLVYVGP